MAYPRSQLFKILGTLALFAAFALAAIFVSVWIATPRPAPPPDAGSLPQMPAPPSTEGLEMAAPNGAEEAAE